MAGMLVQADNPILPEAEWQARRARHEQRLQPLVGPHVARQSRQEKHPIYDFLFEYYGFRPSWLMRWSPGLGVVLAGPTARDYLKHREYHEVGGGVALNPAQLSRDRQPAARWILNLLEITAERPPRFARPGQKDPIAAMIDELEGDGTTGSVAPPETAQ